MSTPTAFEDTDPFTPQARHLTVVSAGLGEPSATRMLADRLAEAASASLSAAGITPEVHVVGLRELASDITDGLITLARSEALERALEEVEQADGLIAVSPTFKASYSGLFKSFWDLTADGAVAGAPVLLGATGGTSRHSLMIDTAMRPLFSYLKTRIIPTAVFAATDDWGEVDAAPEEPNSAPLQARIRAAGAEFADVVGRLPARPRRAPGTPENLEVTPFERLLRGE